MTKIENKLFVVSLTAAMTLAISRPSHAGCGSDVECKGERVCIDGACVGPAAPACQTDLNCAGDAVCEAGTCRAPGLPVAGAAAPAPPPRAAMGQAPPSTPVPTAPPYGPDATATKSRGILGLIIAGPIVLGVSWLATIGVTAGLDADGDLIGLSAIPLAGPWVMIADDRTSDYTAALGVSGVLQLGGLTMLILGVSIRRQIPAAYGALDLEVTPLAGPDATGLALTGRF